MRPPAASSRYAHALRRLQQRLLGLVDFFIPEALESAAGDGLRRARLAVGASAAVAACGLLGLASVLRSGPAGNVPMLLALVFAAAAVPPALKRTGSILLAAHALAGVAFLGLAVIAINAGGRLAPPYVLLPAVPMLAMLIAGGRAGLVWAAASWAGLAALALWMRAGLEPALPIDGDLVAHARFRGSVIMVALVLLVTLVYDQLRLQALGEARAARREAERRSAEVERAHRELADFTWIASHDLMEPLRGIHNYARFLLEDHADRLDADGRGKLEALARLTRRMGSQIDALRHLSRVGRGALAHEPVAVRDVVEEALDRLAEQIQERQAEVRIEDPLPSLRCDRELLLEVFEHLLSNALKFNDKPEMLVTVGARPGAAGATAPVLFVRDNGIGIRERHQESIFRMFKRLHPRDKFGGGTGAGMAIVRKIVELHGGRIWVESEEGAGANFCFTLEAEAG